MGNSKEVETLKKGRDSNIELLRVVAMFMIVIYHIVCHCVNVQLQSSTAFSQPIFYKRLYIMTGILKWGPMANAIFILISGYFLVGKGKNVNIISIAKKLLTQLGFAAMMLVFGSCCLLNIFNRAHLTAVSFDFNNMSWFVGYYFVIIAIAKVFLNEYLLKLNQKSYSVFLVIMFAITQFWWPNGIFNSISPELGKIAVGIFLYAFGGYIRKYEPFRNVRVLAFVLIIVFLNFIMYVANYNVTNTAIRNFDFTNPDAVFSQTILLSTDRDFVVIAIAVCLFEIFRRVKIPNNHVINSLATATFMVYLTHDNEFFYSLWGVKNWIKVLHDTPWLFVFDLFIWGAATFTAGVAMYIGYLLVMKVFKISRSIYIRSEK